MGPLTIQDGGAHVPQNSFIDHYQIPGVLEPLTIQDGGAHVRPMKLQYCAQVITFNFREC